MWKEVWHSAAVVFPIGGIYILVNFNEIYAAGEDYDCVVAITAGAIGL